MLFCKGENKHCFYRRRGPNAKGKKRWTKKYWIIKKKNKLKKQKKNSQTDWVFSLKASEVASQGCKALATSEASARSELEMPPTFSLKFSPLFAALRHWTFQHKKNDFVLIFQRKEKTEKKKTCLKKGSGKSSFFFIVLVHFLTCHHFTISCSQSRLHCCQLHRWNCRVSYPISCKVSQKNLHTILSTLHTVSTAKKMLKHLRFGSCLRGMCCITTLKHVVESFRKTVQLHWVRAKYTKWLYV